MRARVCVCVCVRALTVLQKGGFQVFPPRVCICIYSFLAAFIYCFMKNFRTDTLYHYSSS